MTRDDWNKISPGKTILSVETDEGEKKMLFKFFLCNSENFDGYWMCCTEDLSNPHPNEIKEDDWNVYMEHAEVISF